MSTIETLTGMSKNVHLLHSIAFLLEWDQETYMPPGAIDLRSQQKELIASKIHKKMTSSHFERALAEAIDLDTGEVRNHFNEMEMAMLKEWRRDFLLAKKLPSEFVEETARESSIATNFWAKAREKNDFASFVPHLEKQVELMRKRADFFGYKEHPYDALIDEREPNMTTNTLHTLFTELKPFLVDLLERIKSKPVPETSFLSQECSEEGQWKIARLMMEKMGIDPNYSRLDLTAHPFCISYHPHDVRLTTHIKTDNLMGHIGTTLHEGGHGLYQLGLPLEHFGTPLCEPLSFAMHESQSRMWETMVGQSKPFWEYFYPELTKIFPHFQSTSLENFVHGINAVNPSLIRIYADEVTYCLHIILRFELELELMEEKISVSDLPKHWNEKMQTYLGITPKTDREGCLQDIHWACGLFGYFPTYALGNIYAAQFFATYKKSRPDYEKDLRSGNLLPLTEWLKTHIHSKGRRFLIDDLTQEVTGEPLTSKHYMNYLEEKYSALYNL